MTFKVLALVVERFWHVCWISYCNVKILDHQRWHFYNVLLQIHWGSCLQRICIIDLSLIKLVQNEQGCNFLPHNVVLTANWQKLIFWLSNYLRYLRCNTMDTHYWQKHAPCQCSTTFSVVTSSQLCFFMVHTTPASTNFFSCPSLKHFVQE